MTEALFQGFVTASDLKRRGWTETIIRRFLSQPCGRAPNPHHARGAPVRLYATDRVKDAESHTEFSTAIARAQAASTRGKRAVATKMEAARQRAWAIPVTLADLDWSDLRAAASERIEHAQQGHLPFPADELVAAAAVDLLLEGCNPHFWEIDDLFSCPGARVARAVLRKRIYAMIRDRYRELGGECERRFNAEAGVIGS